MGMKKSEAMKRWNELPEGQDPLPHMYPIPYKAEGSKYGTGGIRIDGSREFIEAVLSNIKELLEGENTDTRLELAWNTVKPTIVNGNAKNFENADEDAEVVYIRLHERGRTAKAMNRMFK